MSHIKYTDNTTNQNKLDEEWYQESILQYYKNFSTGTEDNIQIPIYADDFYMTINKNLIICKWGYLDTNIVIKDVIVEEKVLCNYDGSIDIIEYLILLTDKGNKILAMNKIYNTPTVYEDFNYRYYYNHPRQLYYDYIIGNFSFNSLCYCRIKSRVQERTILDILAQKIAVPNGHFHHSNEAYIYHKIFGLGITKQLKAYLNNREFTSKYFYNYTSKHKLNFLKKEEHDTFNIIECNEENYLDEDDTILDASISTDYKEPLVKKICITYETKNNQVKSITLGKYIEHNFVYSRSFLELENFLSPKTIYDYFENRYINPNFIHYCNLYTFYALPSNEAQINKIVDILLLQKRRKLDEHIIELLKLCCKKKLSTFNSVNGDILKQLKEIDKSSEQRLQIDKNSQIKQIARQLLFYLQQIDQLINTMKELQNTNFSIQRINIPVDSILIEVDDHFEINPILIPYLKYINLGGVLFTNVKVSGIDFSNTNANIIPKFVYQKDMRYGNYKGLDFTFTSFQDVDITGSLFDEGFNGFLYGDKFLGAINEKSQKTKRK